MLLVTIAAFAVGHEAEAVSDALRRIFGMVRDEQQLGGALADQHVDEAAHQLAIERIQPLQRLVEDQQCRVFHQRAGDQRQPLLAPGKAVERGVTARAVEPEQRQPLFGQLPLTIRNRLINADRIENPDITTLRTLVLTR